MKAAHIVLMNPSNQASVEHFELLKKQWLENAEKLRSLVDEAIDTAAFIRANGMFTHLSLWLRFALAVTWFERN